MVFKKIVSAFWTCSPFSPLNRTMALICNNKKYKFFKGDNNASFHTIWGHMLSLEFFVGLLWTQKYSADAPNNSFILFWLSTMSYLEIKYDRCENYGASFDMKTCCFFIKPHTQCLIRKIKSGNILEQIFSILDFEFCHYF